MQSSGQGCAAGDQIPAYVAKCDVDVQGDAYNPWGFNTLIKINKDRPLLP